MQARPNFTFIDLFAGVGGFHEALAQLGGACVFASEVDPSCQDVYSRNHLRVGGLSKVHGDIRPLTDPVVSPEIPTHDVLCAGFPCQPFSKSGLQRGMSETRGTLFFNILKVLEARTPRFVILENVRNLAGPRQQSTWRTIIRNLERLDYRVAAEPIVFSPHLLAREAGGAPQVRERVFILAEHMPGASPDVLAAPAWVSNAPVDGWDPGAWRIEEFLEDDSAIPNVEQYRLKPEEITWVDTWNAFIEALDCDPLPGFPIWADALVAQPVIPPGTPRWKATFLRKNSDLYVAHKPAIDKWRARHPIDSFPSSRRKLEWQARGWPHDLWQTVLQFRPSGIRAKGPTYLPALVAITQTSIIGSRRRRITPREAARLQGLPETFVLHENDTLAYKQLGNGVNVGAVRYVAAQLFDSSPVGWPGYERVVAEAS